MVPILRQSFTIPLPRHAPMQLGERTLVMGILNVTPDSFADGGLHFGVNEAVAHGRRMIDEGADIIDVGGESTRPGAAPVSEEEELRRVLPVIEQLAATGAIISVDTYKAGVAREAVARGASIVNDISNLQYEPRLASVVAETGAAVILMHNRGRSTDMYREAVYDHVAAEIARELENAVLRACGAGVSRESLILDPGLGFAKRAEHTFAALATLHRLAALGFPLLSGPSRKSFLQLALGERAAADRDWGTAAAVAASILSGAHIVRVHNVGAMADVARVSDAIRAAGETGFAVQARQNPPSGRT